MRRSLAIESLIYVLAVTMYGKKSPRAHSLKLLKRANEVNGGNGHNGSRVPSPGPFYIVGIGASAGGLEAVTQLLRHFTSEAKIAFVVIQHLDPKHSSMSSEILSRATGMNVKEAGEGEVVQGSHVYVIPPNRNLAFFDGKLKLFPRVPSGGRNLPIDFFFKSLAENQKGHAIGIILSGIASDGTKGLGAIREMGGITFAQDPASAKFDGMPRSAISAGVVDFVGTPEWIANELARIARQPLNTGATPALHRASLVPSWPEGEPPKRNLSLARIFESLRERTQVDFSNYKPATVGRRISRRLQALGIGSLKAYANFLESHPMEVDLLFADILIQVTEFFRDPQAFLSLKSRIFPKLLKGRDSDLPVRIWVPGCSSGEEAYSIAISFLEFIDENKIRNPPQIFATDISEAAIQKARAGIYPGNSVKKITEARLQKFFEKTPEGYRIAKRVRDACIFSRHDLTSNPPFAKIDLVSCRNLLIYFESSLQQRVVPILHFALNPGGFLWLGRSESVGRFSNLFKIEDKKNKFYSRKNIATGLKIQFHASQFYPLKGEVGHKAPYSLADRRDLQRESDRMALREYAPPGVVINDSMEILQAHGRTSPFFELAHGQASLNLLKMARPELAADLRLLIESAKKKNTPAKKEGLTLLDNGSLISFAIKVLPIHPLPESKALYFSIFFEVAQALSGNGALNPEKKRPSKRYTAGSERVQSELRNRLLASQNYQQALIERFAAAQEELFLSNEELQSTNEELQSANEELEAAKEELQSTNEELSTVNDELHVRNSEIIQLANDLTNLLTSVDIPIVMVGTDKKIRQITPNAKTALKIGSSNIGYSIGEIKPDLDVPDLDKLVSEVMSAKVFKEIETKDSRGYSYRLQLRPYRNTNNKIEGVVLALVDIDALQRAKEGLKKARDDATTIIETMPLPLLVLNADRTVRAANQSFCGKFRVTREETVGRRVAELGDGQWNDERLLAVIDATLNEGVQFQDFEVEHDFPRIGRKTMILNARKIHMSGSGTSCALLVIEDFTDRIRLLLQEKELRQGFEQANRIKDEFLATLSHELRTPLTTILTWAQILRMGRVDAEKAKNGTAIIEQSARVQGQLIDDLLDISRIQSGKLSLELREADPADAIYSAIESVRHLADKKSIKIETAIEPDLGFVFADAGRLQQIFWNLLTNAIKFTPASGQIKISADRIGNPAGERIRVRVFDDGKGIKAEFIPHIFEKFSQADSSSTRIFGGLGLGLAIVRNLAEMQGGEVAVESPGEGMGSTFTVSFPRRVVSQVQGHQVKERPVRAGPQDQLPARLDGIHVLFVDDEPNAREVFAEMLQSFGAEVKTVGTVNEAMKEFMEHKPDILLSDIGMPNEDGYSLIQKVRALDAGNGKQIPALAITAYAGSDDVQRALAAGFSRHIAKPVDAVFLSRVIAGMARKD